MTNPISPDHYLTHPSGIECIDITRHHTFTIGNAIKYLWRAGQKGDRIEDLRKAAQYLDWAAEDDERVLFHWNDFLIWHGRTENIRDEDQVIYWILTDELCEARLMLAELIESIDG